MTNSNGRRELHHRNMHGVIIPHSVNPGPQIECAHCKLLRSGSDFESDLVLAPCRSCRATAPKSLTMRSALNYITAHPGCTVNDVLDWHSMPLDTSLDDAEYRDRESTGAAILEALADQEFVRYVVTSWDGWKYTATGKVWS